MARAAAAARSAPATTGGRAAPARQAPRRPATPAKRPARRASGRAVVPTAGEVADNPRAKSSRLRSARKLVAPEAG